MKTQNCKDRLGKIISFILIQIKKSRHCKRSKKALMTIESVKYALEVCIFRDAILEICIVLSSKYAHESDPEKLKRKRSNTTHPQYMTSDELICRFGQKEQKVRFDSYFHPRSEMVHTPSPIFFLPSQVTR